ncbi:hypothetical protein Ptr902_04185 [Pyrenophora tritici-repentis]|nr:hypothetical protein Alg130_10123 [Pyrenophora tritici-repentis]KAI0605673.1 hypothetical protein TUN205_10078 [Pyrenophora tritici-repentis]KAI0617884.1 hypothetical protein TUN199_10125 [Pyrenophora tritici-repentis]KAI1561718.1 hypothetical protein PtrEW4_010432 [Pyrenophora tritici-repentis]KAI2485245.1 hypothetical protein Ptr902_04185 [Pyrenophora tritici-repentis]
MRPRVKDTFVAQDLTDDSTEVIPVIGLQKVMSLKDRLINRLSQTIKRDVTLEEDTIHQSIKIHVFPNRSSPQAPLDGETQKLLSTMMDTLSLIAKHKQGPTYDDACEVLWNAILEYSYPHIDGVIDSMNRIFDTETFQSSIANFTMPQPESTADEELGTRLLTLCQDVKGCESSLKNINALAQVASTMTRVIMNLGERLKFFLRKAQISNELYQLICELGFPERIHKTLIRAARTCSNFLHPTIHLERVSLSNGRPLMQRAEFPDSRGALSAPKPAPPPQISNSKRIPFQQATSEACLSSSPPASQLRASTQPSSLGQPRTTMYCAVMETAQKYLAQEDRHQTFLRLKPDTKQLVAHLVGTLLRTRLLPVDVEAWQAFGFVTASSEEEERQLAGLYSVLLKEAENPQKIFCDLQRALETNTLTVLFDNNGYGHFRQMFPKLEAFLRTPPAQRSTVWRLKQFVLNKNETEPPAWAQRDYGFKFCKQREEVLLLKEIYNKICKKISLKDLHTACIHGRLYEAAVQKGVFVDAKYKRLMQNDYPSPFLGYENDKGLKNYRGSFFKKR